VPKNGFYKSDLLAFNNCFNEDLKNNIGGIYLIQPDSTSGKILSLGSMDWCLEKNQKNEIVSGITKKALQLLMK